MLKGVQGWGGGGCSPQSGNIPAIITCKIFLFDKMQIHNLALLVPNSFEKFWRPIIPKLSSTKGRDFCKELLSALVLLSKKNQLKRIHCRTCDLQYPGIQRIPDFKIQYWTSGVIKVGTDGRRHIWETAFLQAHFVKHLKPVLKYV